MSFYLNWYQNGVLLRGNSGTWVDGVLPFPVVFPGTTSAVQEMRLSSSAQDGQTYETLKNCKFYLIGDPDDVDIVQSQWPYTSTTRLELNGGLEISFDSGKTFTRFDKQHGYQPDPTTWIPLPASAMGQLGVDQTIGPFDVATLNLRYIVPPGATQFTVLNLQLELDCDVI